MPHDDHALKETSNLAFGLFANFCEEISLPAPRPRVRILTPTLGFQPSFVGAGMELASSSRIKSRRGWYHFYPSPSFIFGVAMAAILIHAPGLQIAPSGE